MERVAQWSLVAFALGAMWWALRPRYLFVISVTGSRARVTRGAVAPDFVAEVAVVFAEYGLTRGRVSGVRRAKGSSLAFSRGVPPGCRQRLRNVWALPR